MVIQLKRAISKTGNPMIEVWDEDVFVCGIYPHEDHIKITSKYLKDVIEVPVITTSVDGKKVRQVRITFEETKP